MSTFIKRIIGTSFDDESIFQKKISKLDYTYVIYGKEVCPTTKKPHLQFFIILGKKKRFTAVAKRLSCHIEPAKGTDKECVDYCSKDGCVTQFGNLPLSQPSKQEAQQQQWQELLKAAKDRQLELIATKNPRLFVQNFHRWKSIGDHYLQSFPKVESRTCIWLHSRKSGTGKSRWCEQNFPNAYRKSLTSKFFQGYVDQDTILIEDLDTSHVSFGHDLKLWGDIYPLLVEIKQFHVYLVHRRLIVTSNYEIAELWQDQRLVDAIRRRFLEFRVVEWENNDALVWHRGDQGYLNNFMLNYDFF